MRVPRLSCFLLVSSLLICVLVPATTQAQPPASRARIVSPVDDSSLVTLRGNTHPLARPQFDQGAAPADLQLHRMLLLLSRSPEQQAALDAFVESQHTPGSPNFRQWLTPADFGAKFGPAASDVQAVSGWLQRQGFSVARMAGGNTVIEFSGSAAQVKQAFHTELHKYVVKGEQHWANAQDPQIPAALAPVVRGVVSLNDFRPKPLLRRGGIFSRDPNGKVTPAVTLSGGGRTYYALGPADFANIYSTAPLLQAGNKGAGETIAVLGESNVNLQDVADFRNFFGLGAGNTQVFVDGPDPGITGAETEADLDLEWANAVAPDAAVLLVAAAGTETTAGVGLAALHAIENNLADVVSMSFGTCESHLGVAGNQFYQSLWEQAAAQGTTVIVSSGDSGSAGCDNQDVEGAAADGLGVNGFASTAYNVAVGGTDFNDAGSQSLYWNTVNPLPSLGTAKSYIPEMTWNQTCAASASAGDLAVCAGVAANQLDIYAGSGGASSCVTFDSSGNCQGGREKPAWQVASGVPADNVRDLPDVSLYAANTSSSNSFYIVCEADALPPGYPSCQLSGSAVYFLNVGGTSASAPTFAAIVALAAQKAGARLGNLNPLLYKIASGSGASCTSAASPSSGCAFNDVVLGNISVPCAAGTPSCSSPSGSGTGVMVTGNSPAYTAGPGYDLATGLGSVNAANLANSIVSLSRASSSAALQLNGSDGSNGNVITATHGTPIAVDVNVSPADAAGDVSLIGAVGGFDHQALTGGIANWNSALFPGGTYTVKARYAGDASHQPADSNPISVNIAAEPSKTFVGLVSFDAAGAHYYQASVPYGSPYLLRSDVGDANATVSATGVNSTCSKGTASCPTGTVTVSSTGPAPYSANLKLNSQGFGEDQLIQLPGGNYTFTATYSGDVSYAGPKSGTNAITIAPAATNLVATTVGTTQPYGAPMLIDVRVGTTSSGVGPTGTVSLLDNSNPAAANTVSQEYETPTAASGSAYATLYWEGFYFGPSVGTHTLTAQYGGDSNYAASAAPALSLNITKAGMWFANPGSVPTATTPSLPITLSDSVSTVSHLAAPTGTVTFTDNGTSLPGNPTVSMWAGAQVTGTQPTNAGFSAQQTITLTQPGTHQLTLLYSGDSNYNAIAQDLGTVTVSDKLPSVTGRPGSLMTPALVNYPTTLVVPLNALNVPSAAPAPTGNVVFMDNGQALGGTVTYANKAPGPYAGFVATMPYSFTTTGTHTLTATYSGDATYAASSTGQALSLPVVDKLATSIPIVSINSSLVASQAATLSIEVVSPSGTSAFPVMTGTVTFTDNNTPITGTPAIVQMAGSLAAQITYTFPTAGTHTIGVQYSGDTDYAPSSATFPEQVSPALSLAILGANQFTTPATGGTGTVTIDAANHTNAPMTVTITCTPDSSAAKCSASPAAPSVPANAFTPVVISYTVPALSGRATPVFPFGGTFVFAGVLAGLACITRKRRPLALTILAFAAAVTVTSCGGGGGSSSTTPVAGSTATPPSPKVYNFTITATAGANSDSKTITVTVQ